MRRVLITGMSGAGKSSVIEELRRRHYPAVDTDYGDWREWKDDGPEPGWVWREDQIQALLEEEHPLPLFVSGTESNQGKFYPRFDAVVLLTAPVETLLERVAARQNNPYGKREEERAEIVQYVGWVEPLLRAGCTHEIDTSRSGLGQVTDQLVAIAEGRG